MKLIKYITSTGCLIWVRANSQWDKRISEESWKHYHYLGMPDYSQAQTIIDIGAHIGSFGCMALHHNQDATYIGIEPYFDNLYVAVANLATRPNAHLEFAYCGYETKGSFIQAHPQNEGCTVIIPVEKNTDKLIGIKTLQCPSITLETIIEKYSLHTIDILKVDCEGGEYDIFQNCEESTLRRIKWIVMEYHHQKPAYTAVEAYRKFLEPRLEQRFNTQYFLEALDWGRVILKNKEI